MWILCYDGMTLLSSLCYTHNVTWKHLYKPYYLQDLYSCSQVFADCRGMCINSRFKNRNFTYASMCWENTLSAILNWRLLYSSWFTFISYINQFPISLTFLFLYKYLLGKTIGFRRLKSSNLFLGEKEASFAEFLHTATIFHSYIVKYIFLPQLPQ